MYLIGNLSLTYSLFNFSDNFISVIGQPLFLFSLLNKVQVAYLLELDTWVNPFIKTMLKDNAPLNEENRNLHYCDFFTLNSTEIFKKCVELKRWLLVGDEPIGRSESCHERFENPPIITHVRVLWNVIPV